MKWLTSFAGILTSIASLAFASPIAFAQNNPSVASPLQVVEDPNGVNIADGKLVMDMPSISVPGASHLRFEHVQDAAPYVSGQTTAGDPDYATTSLSIHYGGRSSESFNCANTVCESVTGTGSKTGPRGGSFQKAGSGERYLFGLSNGSNNIDPHAIFKWASSVVYPDGEIITYSYDTHNNPNQYVDFRPARLTSNLGYYLEIKYRSDIYSDVGNDWVTVKSAAIYKSDDQMTPLAKLTYNTDYTITDLSGRVYNYNTTNALGIVLETATGSLTLPGDTVARRLVTPTTGNGLVGAVTIDGVQWSYAYNNPRYEPYLGGFRYDGLTVSGPAGYQQTYAVDGTNPQWNLIASSKDSLNRTTRYDYKQYTTLVSKITYPEGNSVAIDYDENGNIVGKTATAKPGSGTTPASVNESGGVGSECATIGGLYCYRLTWTQDELGRRTSYTYNSYGQVTEQIDPADRLGVVRHTYNEYEAYDTGAGTILRRKVVRVCGIDPGGTRTTCGTTAEIRTEYDYWQKTFLPRVERRIDAAAGVTLTTNYTYDTAGRPTVIDGPTPGSADAQYFRYDILGRKTWEIGAANAGGVRVAKRYTYRDSDDKVTLVETGSIPDQNSTALTVASKVSIAYDPRRNAKREVRYDGTMRVAVTDRTFDTRSQLICQTVRMNAAVFSSLPSDACTPGTAGTFGADRITHNVYDAAGQLLTVQKAYATSLQQDYAAYTYSDNGQRASMTDANGNFATLAYDGYDRLRTWTFPSKTVKGQTNAADYEQYGYDVGGNRTSLRKRDGRTITFTYDNLARMISKLIPDGCAPLVTVRCPLASATRDVYYDYDMRDLQTSARFDSPSGPGVSFVYDGFGRVASTTSSLSGVNRTLTYIYDESGSRKRITHQGNIRFDYAYDARDALQSVKDGSGAVLTAIGYDDLGRRTSDLSGAETYGYDGVDRVTSHSLAFGQAYDGAETFSYSPASQIATKGRTNDAYAFSGYTSVDRAYTVNGLNQYGSAGPATFAYDANGNLTGDGTYSYGYDAENRLVSRWSGAAQVSALAYDPLGRLWQVGDQNATRQLLYDGDALAAEYDGAGAVAKRFVHATGPDEPILWYEGAAVTAAARRTLVADYQGSIVLVLDGSGNQVAINAYDEYGIGKNSATGATAPYGRFGYTGQAWLPELGMYYYKARIYSPTLGRFMQTDPVGYEDQNNLYAYVANDPVNRADPSGTQGEPGVGHNSATFGEMLEDAAEVAVDTGRVVAGRVALGVSLLVTSEAAGPLGNPEAGKRLNYQSSRVTSLSRAIRPRSIEAALTEARGGVVKLRSDGTPFDHVNKLREAQTGLRDAVHQIKTQLGKQLGEDQRFSANRLLGQASKALDQVNRALSKVDRICTGTRICP